MAASRSISAPKNNKIEDFYKSPFPPSELCGPSVLCSHTRILTQPPAVWSVRDDGCSLSGKGDDNKNTAFDI